MNSTTQLRNRLYVTDADTARTLPDNHDFNEVVTLGYMDVFGNKYPATSTTLTQFKFRDGPHKYEQFEAAVTYVLAHLRAGDTVLVHCQAGVSRSPSVCIAALATLEDRDPEMVRSNVEDVHPRTNPEPPVWDSVKQFVEENR